MLFSSLFASMRLSVQQLDTKLKGQQPVAGQFQHPTGKNLAWLLLASFLSNPIASSSIHPAV